LNKQDAFMSLPGAASHLGFDTAAPDVLRSVFAEAVGVLERADVPYVLIGGLATAALGRPRCSADVDVLVRPIDAHRALAAFAAHGFETEETNPHWLFKATKRGVLVDILFKGPKDIYLDDAMLARAPVVRVMDQRVRVAPAEDLVVMKALVHDEETPRHWHDALALVASAELDWDYLLARARKGNRRVLSLMLYALSIDLVVPLVPLNALFERILTGEDARDGD
jgi:predicted nucleotidyltransferase